VMTIVDTKGKVVSQVALSPEHGFLHPWPPMKGKEGMMMEHPHDGPQAQPVPAPSAGQTPKS